MDTPKIPRTSERSARRRRRTAWTVVGQPDSPAQSPGDVPEGWKRPERHLPDQGTMSSPPHLGRGEVSMTQENPDRREVVATAAPRSGNSPIDGGSPAGESASRVSGRHECRVACCQGGAIFLGPPSDSWKWRPEETCSLPTYPALRDTRRQDCRGRRCPDTSESRDSGLHPSADGRQRG